MSQIRVPAGQSASAENERAATRWIDAIVVIALVVLVYGVVRAASRWAAPLSETPHIDTSLRSLPLYAGLSTARMAAAYAISIVFSIAYARAAIGSRAAERVMLPLLDILQSVPILSFLPGVVLALVALFPHSNVGLELSAILLIFTSTPEAHSLLGTAIDWGRYAELFAYDDETGELHLEDVEGSGA